jgi:hypothetical protein
MASSQSPQENGRSYAASVTVTDESGRSLQCYVEHSFDADGENYVFLLPVDVPIEILRWEDRGEEEEAVPIDDAELDRVLPSARAVLEEHNLTLKLTAVTLTVAGELPDLDEGEFIEAEDEDDEVEALQWLASFFDDRREYAIYAPVDPFLILARMNRYGDPELLSPEEFQQIEHLLPSIEAMLEERLFDDLD